MVSNTYITIHKRTNAINSQVNEKPRDFLVDLKRKRSFFTVELSEEPSILEGLNLNFLVVLGMNIIVS